MPPTPYQVLVVDDEPNVRAVVRRYLDSTRYQTVEAGDKLSFLEQLSTQSFDYVITDLGLPGFDSEQLIQAIMHHTTHPQTQAIVMAPMAADRPRFVSPLHWGNVHVLEKPFSAKDLNKLLTLIEATSESEQVVSH